MMIGLKLAYFLLICVLLIFPSHGMANSPSPADTLDKISMAVDNADLATFEELVDTESIINDCLQTFLRESQNPVNVARMPALMTLLFRQASADNESGEKLRSILRSEALAFLRNGVQSGAFAGKKLSVTRNSGILAPLFAGASIGRKEVRGVGDAIGDGEGWVLPFSVHDYGNDQDYQVQARFSPTDKGWRLTSVQNLPQLIEQIYGELNAQ